LIAVRAKKLVSTSLMYGSLLLMTSIIVLPLIALVFASFKSGEEYLTTGPFDPPRNWFNIENFLIAFEKGQMFNGFVNTGFIMSVSLAGTIVIGTMVAYALDRFQFPGNRIVLALFLIAALVPGVTTQVATFQIIVSLGLFNTHWAAIVLFMGTDIIAIYIFIQFMASIPKSLDESAMIDGANHFTIYWKIILPNLMPAIATVIIIKGIAIYNEFYIPFLYMPSQDLGVISTALFRFRGPFSASWELIAAGTLLVILPSLIVFLFLQRFIYRGLTSGAVK
jgi:raffinose/stachyose/melibiose transport system permease protein